MSYSFTIGKHAQQAHDYVSALIDGAYSRKNAGNPTAPSERVSHAEAICESYYAQVGQQPPSAVLSRLAWYLVFDEMTDSHPDKMTREEFPMISRSQEKLRRRREMPISDVYTGNSDINIGRYTDKKDGVKRIMYDYMTPAKDSALIPSDYLVLIEAIDSADLSNNQRTVLRRIYVEGFNQSEIAAELGVSQARISQYLNGALDKLYEYLTR